MMNKHRAEHPSLSEVHETVDTTIPRKGWRRILAYIGPAYLVSVGYMDPGNWATDLAAGSTYGYSLLWVVALSSLMAVLLQSLCCRLGIATGLVAKRHGHPTLLMLLLTATIVLFNSQDGTLLMMADKRLQANAIGIAIAIGVMAVADPAERSLLRRQRA